MNLFKFCTLFIYLSFTYYSFSAEVFDQKLLYKKGDWEVVLLDMMTEAQHVLQEMA